MSYDVAGERARVRSCWSPLKSVRQEKAAVHSERQAPLAILLASRAGRCVDNRMMHLPPSLLVPSASPVRSILALPSIPFYHYQPRRHPDPPTLPSSILLSPSSPSYNLNLIQPQPPRPSTTVSISPAPSPDAKSCSCPIWSSRHMFVVMLRCLIQRWCCWQRGRVARGARRRSPNLKRRGSLVWEL